jgi:hypothetical protein
MMAAASLSNCKNSKVVVGCTMFSQDMGRVYPFICILISDTCVDHVLSEVLVNALPFIKPFPAWIQQVESSHMSAHQASSVRATLKFHIQNA